jgi:tetratricopeptide (TPR) repeat protein
MSEEAEALGAGRPELEGETGLSPYGLLLVQRGNMLTYLARPAEGAAAIDRAIELARARREAELLAFAHVCRVVPCDVLGEHEQAFAHARRAVEVAESCGNTFLNALAMSALGHAQVANGRWREAAEALTGVVEPVRGGRAAPLVESDSMALLAEAQLGAGDAAGALATADAARDVARAYHRPLAEARADLARARALLALRDGDAAALVHAVLDEASGLVDATGAAVLTPFIHAERARIASRTGDRAASERELRESERLFTAMGATRRAQALR